LAELRHYFLVVSLCLFLVFLRRQLKLALGLCEGAMFLVILVQPPNVALCQLHETLVNVMFISSDTQKAAHYTLLRRRPVFHRMPRNIPSFQNMSLQATIEVSGSTKCIYRL